MTHGQTVLVACMIESGAFSSERVFRFNLADGADYSGVAPVHYCLTRDKQPLGQAQPSKGQQIEGLVEAFLVTNGGDQATVELPNGDAVPIKLSQVAFRQSQDREPKYVPLGS